ncbi:MAG: DUF58 domain-containing protein [Clostridia bacterium]|nr:DUF58 domain-containing protein [Clostridia bacterium]
MDKTTYINSSYIASWPFICINFVASVLFAYFGIELVAALFMLLFFIGLVAFLWSLGSTKNLLCDFRYSSYGLFPGDTLYIDVKLNNKKFLPVLWVKVNDLCSKEFTVDGLLWYEETTIRREWTADKRGIKHLEDRSVVTGDGFGLRQNYLKDNISGPKAIAIYPRRVNVNPKIFMKNLWNADTGRNGVMEDVTVIKQERPYLPTDPAKRINFRLAARNLPLSVNLYEEIMPRGVHFIFDGESFAGDDEALEEALSILASLLVELERLGYASSMSICEGKNNRAVCYGPSDPVDAMLYSLAEYENFDTERNDDGSIKIQDSIFDASSILALSGKVGRFYYICKDFVSAARCRMLNGFDNNLTLLTYEEGGEQWIESIALRTLLL